MGEENSAFTLPRNWLWTSIREASVLVTKGSTPTSYGFGFTKQGINFVKVENMANGCVARETIKEFVTQEAHDFLKRSQLAEKDVLFSIAGTIGRVAVVRGEDLPANINQAIAIIRCPWRFLNPQYLKTFLDSTWARLSIQKKPRGVGMNNVSLEDVKNITFPLAPVNEQVRIVVRLEELFARLDAGVEGLRKVKAQLKRYRQAVLKYSFDGKLTEEWRKTHRDQIEPATKLLENMKQERKKDPKYRESPPLDRSELPQLPEGWVWTPIGRLYNIIGGGTPATNVAEYWDGDFPWITSADIHGLKDVRPQRYVTKEGIKNSATNLVPEESLIVVTRVGLGKVALTRTPICFSQDSQALVGNSNFICPEYALYYLSKAVQIFKYKHRGTTIAGVTKRQLAELPFPLSPISEQLKIIEEVERRYSVADEIEKTVEQGIRQSERLRQSILKTAFEGKLVPQDPSDEPAEKLLERIREERAKSKDEKDVNRRKKIKPRQLELSTYAK